jgi:murein DD-endopeptidase MepM/ murein hydrolase activator NlpD
MTTSKIADEFPLVDDSSEIPEELPPEAPPIESEIEPENDQAPGRFTLFWERLSSFGLAEQAVRLGTHALFLILVLVVVWAMRSFYLQAQEQQFAAPVEEAALAAPAETPTTVSPELELPAFEAAGGPLLPETITRNVLLHTTIPSRPRVDVLTYTVQVGDTLFGIADNFGLQPETILWGNYEVLEDNPHLLVPDQVLNILPVNGTYHLWHEGENLSKVAEFYRVQPESIIEYSGNRMDVALASVDNPSIDPGSWLIIPNGWRPLKDWGPPAISRTNPASARYYGPGHCGSIYEGPIGVGTFVWPTTSRQISGYNYSGIHPAIDIGGSLGNAIYATDSGVVVYAGWSNYGYGYLIVIDHGNGWQSAYAHLSSTNVGCGQGVFQGGLIGGLGSTGNSSGPHLHFELLFNGAKVNPLNFLQ